MRSLLICLVICAAAPSSWAQASELPTRIERSERQIARWCAPYVARDGHHGVVLGLVQGHKSFVRGFGRPGRQAEETLGPDHLFEIGSITKVFTSLLLAKYVLEGVLDPDAPLSRYLPEACRVASASGREPTLRLLANHHSGLPRMPTNLRPATGLDPYRGYENEQLWAFLAELELRREPGASYEYSNLAVGLLGQLVARAAGTEYETLVERDLLVPLGMTNSAFRPDRAQLTRLARGHAASGLPVPSWHFDALAPAGALRSSMRDMLRFASACLAPTPGFERILALTLADRRRVGEAIEVGLGWHVTKEPGSAEPALVWHNGQTGGYRSFLGLQPGRGTAIVVLTNCTGEPAPGRLAHQVLRALAAGELALRWRAEL